ncbi:Fpg/Nei family DNA glycosylase [bacterium]|nr:Fpg/Nei family DNA glycosylase [bacterium]
MPELPEMVVIAEQMNHMLQGKKIQNVTIFQPKCLNRLVQDYEVYLLGEKIEAIQPLGKWVRIDFSSGMRLLINLGMGGELCYLKKDRHYPEKTKFVLRFTDGTGLFITFWWFGYIHLVLRDENHPMTDTLGPDPLSLTCEAFQQLLKHQQGRIKSFLLNQKKIRGIGNFYIQEILFKAQLHPVRKISSLSNHEIGILFGAIQNVLRESIDLESSSYEQDFFGKKGRYGLDQISIGYKENVPCPVCHSQIKKIKTGSTAQFICPKCQKTGEITCL